MAPCRDPDLRHDGRARATSSPRRWCGRRPTAAPTQPQLAAAVARPRATPRRRTRPSRRLRRASTGDPLASWIEDTFGVTEEAGVRPADPPRPRPPVRRRPPRTLAELTGDAGQDAARSAIRATLLAGPGPRTRTRASVCSRSGCTSSSPRAARSTPRPSPSPRRAIVTRLPGGAARRPGTPAATRWRSAASAARSTCWPPTPRTMRRHRASGGPPRHVPAGRPGWADRRLPVRVGCGPVAERPVGGVTAALVVVGRDPNWAEGGDGPPQEPARPGAGRPRRPTGRGDRDRGRGRWGRGFRATSGSA